MIPSVLRPKLRTYSYGSIKAPSGPVSSRMIDMLYPERQMTLGEIRSGLGDTRSKNYARSILWRLANRGLVAHVGGRYLLTDIGRWLAISRHLGLSFVELCVLASACCVQKRYAESGKIGFYMRSSFEDILGEYYSKGYILTVFASLKRKGFAAKYVKKAVRVYPGTCNDLMARYGTYLEGLESWLDGIKENELEIFSRTLDGFDWKDAHLMN